MNLLENTADFVSSQLSSGTTDPGVLQDVGASLLHGISNVMSAASTGAKQEEGDAKEEEENDIKDDSTKQTDKEKKKDAKQKVQCIASCMTFTAIWRSMEVTMKRALGLGSNH